MTSHSRAWTLGTFAQRKWMWYNFLFLCVCETLHPPAFRGFTFNSAASLIRVIEVKLHNLRTEKVFAQDIFLFCPSSVEDRFLFTNIRISRLCLHSQTVTLRTHTQDSLLNNPHYAGHNNFHSNTLNILPLKILVLLQSAHLYQIAHIYI